MFCLSAGLSLGRTDMWLRAASYVILRFIILFSIELISVMALMDVAVVNSFLQYFPLLALGFFLFLALPMSWTVITLLNCL